ncbi:hypothetical protein KIW84_022404 [Lathyrus oleraceus]|uniref:Uncharacterized protein n=1 Tax=Pisum sativum TaxID=3888 RepID=A0A9D4YAH3_PEA|nr:hypothetical protein KIW84_022404 [Pisum sativum]
MDKKQLQCHGIQDSYSKRVEIEEPVRNSLPLMLRFEIVARKIGSILGTFEEMDLNEAHRNCHFLRIKVTIDLKSLFKKRMDHQMKYGEALKDFNEEGFKELEEQNLSFG